jgi:hypothetical protein
MKHISAILFLLSLSIISFGQTIPDRETCKKAVGKYLSKRSKDYKPKSWGECFVQKCPKEVQDKIKTKREVKYSMVHSYSIGGNKIVDMYFHLDKDFEVVGQLTSDEMMEITMSLLKKSPKLDSIMSSMPH